MKGFMLHTLLPAFNSVGFEYEGELPEDLEDGYFFLLDPKKGIRAILSLDEEAVFFSKEELVFYELPFEELAGMSLPRMKRKLRIISFFHSLLIPECPENWSDYLERNFYIG